MPPSLKVDFVCRVIAKLLALWTPSEKKKLDILNGPAMTALENLRALTAASLEGGATTTENFNATIYILNKSPRVSGA